MPSFRDVEELLAARGIVVTYETVRQWCLKFGQKFSNEVRRRQPQGSDTWFLDEVFMTIGVQRHYLWRAVDQFKPNRGLTIADERRRRRQTEEAILRAKNKPPGQMRNLESDPMIEQIAKLAERA